MLHSCVIKDMPAVNYEYKWYDGRNQRRKPQPTRR